MSGSVSAAAAPILCNVCNTCYAIYTCPRCSARTCSLPCSSNHKTATNCSGERDKVAFVNMKDYSLGTLMSDFTYLEEVGRKVGEWGSVIAKGSYATPAPPNRAMRGGRGYGRTGRGGSSFHKTKRDILKSQLETHDISMDLLPVGMTKRQHNQSIWDFKNQTAYLTIEFKFHPPRSSTSKHESPISFLTHRNNLNDPLLSLIANHVRDRRSQDLKREKAQGKQKAANAGGEIFEKGSGNYGFPAWLVDLVEDIPNLRTPTLEEDQHFSPFDSLIRAPISPTALTISGTRPKAAYHRVVPTEPLLTALRNTYFVEYPMLELWPQGEFSGVLADQHTEARASSGLMEQQLVFEQGNHKPEDQVERRAKRRKVQLRDGKKTISGLLGGYGSGEESDNQDGGKKDGQNGLAFLGGYAGSDDELGEDSDDDQGEVELSPEVLLELMKNAHGGTSWTDDSREDERVDWGDEYSEGEGEEGGN
ncbi:hypothetical protein D9757_000265 [Collybiopsis confluens]|uniref:HIT-type domain-containing protein n=1 Tax=Collybiopsis confluens TaxID=2823264 RepID=A0A8H5I234_9AGAR|nr:hypothetical protein D9757_000265 [Collybiopsis confluens]